MSEPRRINAEGRPDARLVLIGEAGGENEERLGRPFVGASGFKLNSWWSGLGLSRHQFYIDNVYPFRPPGNDFAALLTTNYELIHAWANDLHERLAALVDPWVIVPTGNVALRALMRRPLDDKTITITKYRGSIMAYTDDRGREIKMIPTIHPASIYHQRAKKARGQEKSNPGRTEKHCQFDWQRIAREAQSREIAAPEETYYIVDEEADIAYWLDYFNTHVAGATPITIDIETPNRVVDCVGFSWAPEFAISIPLKWPGFGPEHPTYAARRALIERICTSPNPKVLQNGPFDIFWLARAESIVVKNYRYELMCMHAALDPVDDHDLGYMKSVFLRGQYHKDEAKSPEKSAKYASSYDACLTYNGMDCCAQIALYYEFQERLIEAGRWDLYETLYAPLLPLLASMMLEGMNTSRLERRIGNATLVARCIDIQNKLAEHCGFKLHTKKDISRVKIQEYLYGTLGITPQRTRAKRNEPGRVTTNEVALRKIQLKFPAPHPAGVAVGMILEHRRAMKLSQFLSDAKTDDDGRLRSQILPLTEAGRCSSSKNPFGTGVNLFNQDRDPAVRGSFIPDRPDHVILELDASQAESRIVYVLSGDDDLYKLATLNPADFDTHSYNAHLIFGSNKTQTDIFKKKAIAPDLKTVLGYVSNEQRYFGKRVEHGAQRGMGGEKMSDELLKDDVLRTPEECTRNLQFYMRAKPGVPKYFEWIQNLILREKALTNSWGFRWDVRYERMDADLYRRAFSFLPQSEVAFLLYHSLIETQGLIDALGLDARIITTVYDSIVLSIKRCPSTIWSVLDIAWRAMSHERVYQTRNGERPLSMFAEAKLGRTWALSEGIEWKTLPTVDDIDSALQKL